MFIFAIVIAVLLVAALIYCGVLQVNTKKLKAFVGELERELGRVETRVESKLGAFEGDARQGADQVAPQRAAPAHLAAHRCAREHDCFRAQALE
jgi:hypothetical protein